MQLTQHDGVGAMYKAESGHFLHGVNNPTAEELFQSCPTAEELQTARLEELS